MKYRVHEVMEIETPQVRRLSIQIDEVPEKPGYLRSYGVGAIVETKTGARTVNERGEVVEAVDFSLKLTCSLSRDQWEAAKAAVDAAWSQWDTIETAERIVQNECKSAGHDFQWNEELGRNICTRCRGVGNACPP